MSDNVANLLLLEHLKAIQSKLSSMASDIGDLKSDMRGPKSHMAGFMRSEVAQDGSMAAMQTRLERIEHRLELRDRPAPTSTRTPDSLPLICRHDTAP